MSDTWLTKEIFQALEALGLDLAEKDLKLEHPTDLARGDYSSNVALILAKEAKKGPQDLAKKIKAKILKQANSDIKEIQIVEPGFINFYLSEEFFRNSLQEILAKPETFGQTDILKREKIMLEFADPNPFKEFHIGHLMTNVIGEALSRIFSFNGAEVKRACYQGDVGMHVAMTLWGMIKLESELPAAEVTLSEKVRFLGRAYTFGASEYKEGSDNAKEGITLINKKIYKRSDDKLNELYNLGRDWSLKYFETIYAKLGTKFDYYFFESETAEVGQKLVEEGLVKKIFEKGDGGATVFRGGNFDSHLHTRVFLNAEGLPTYEAKELGLAQIKNNKYSADVLVSVTGNEINDYFKVVLRAMQEIMPDIALKIKHLSHGMLRLPSGKMSSRTGAVITAEALIESIKIKVLEKIKDRSLTKGEKDEIVEKVAIGAIKYSILKQGIGKDIIFDFEKSLSFEGDSGPYLQYAYTRALSVLKKAGISKLDFKFPEVQLQEFPDSVRILKSLLYQFPEVTEKAYCELAPQNIATYLIDVAGAFNSFYAQNQIIGAKDETYFLALTQAIATVLKNGLNLLAIPVLERM